MTRKLWAGLAVLALVAAALSSCGGDEDTSTSGAQTTPGTGATEGAPPQEVAAGSARMVVDAVSGGEADATVEVTGAGPFDVDIDILAPSMGYQGYQYYLQWDPKLLAYDGHNDLKPESLDLCANPTVVENRVAAGCARATETTRFAGPVGTATFHCVGEGTSLLHLLTSQDRPASFSTVLAPRGVVIPTELTDASVTCLP